MIPIFSIFAFDLYLYEIEGTKVPSFIGYKLDSRVEQIKSITQDHLPDTSFFVVDVKVSGKMGYEKIVVLVDGDHGIPIDICADIARSLSEELDNLSLFDGSYTLEVSSPGVDYPLSSERQYLKNLGRRLKIDMLNGEVLKGSLLKTDGGGITLSLDTGNRKKVEDTYIPFSDIKKSKVLVAFK